MGKDEPREPLFTVRWIGIDYEELLYARKVWLRDRGTFQDAAKATLGIEQPDGNVRTWSDGHFYVMNETGKTVATYFLDPPDTSAQAKEPVGRGRPRALGPIGLGAAVVPDLPTDR